MLLPASKRRNGHADEIQRVRARRSRAVSGLSLALGPHLSTTKAGAYPAAAQHGMIVVAPETSPRGQNLADDPGYDVGLGAGLYLNATHAPWAPHFRMEGCIVDEPIPLIRTNFPADPVRFGVSGHSMGGHGALALALRHTDVVRSVSAFAPISSPTNCAR